MHEASRVAVPLGQVRRVQTTDRQKFRVVSSPRGRKTIRLTPTGTQNLKPQEKLAIAPQIERHPCPKLRGGTQSLISPMLVRALSRGPLAVVVVAAFLRMLAATRRAISILSVAYRLAAICIVATRKECIVIVMHRCAGVYENLQACAMRGRNEEGELRSTSSPGPTAQ